MTSADGPFRIALADYAGERLDLHAVRDAVFVREQGVPAALETDALDPLSRHAIARDRAGRPIGTARLTPERRIGRMAVLPAWRGAGVGSALLHVLLRQALASGWDEVVLHAQADAVGFYRRHGFVAFGERFQEAGIAHLAMRRRLNRPAAVVDREGAVAATVALIGEARRPLCLHSRELDPGLLDAPAVLDALRGFATAGRGGQARILLHDAARAQRSHAPLLSLAQQLPSAFALREIADPADRDDPSAWIASDAGGYYFRALGHRFEGETDLAGAPRARQLLDGFRQVWERSRPCGELRALGL